MMQQKLFCTNTFYFGLICSSYILNPGTKWRLLVSFTYIIVTLLFPLGVQWAQNSSGHIDKEKLPVPPRIILQLYNPQPVTLLTTLVTHSEEKPFLRLVFVAPSLSLLAIYKNMLDIFVNPSFTSSVSGKSCTLSELLYL